MNVPSREELLEIIDQEARKDFLLGHRVSENVAQHLKVCPAPQEDLRGARSAPAGSRAQRGTSG
jgi:hypothetical protein